MKSPHRHIQLAVFSGALLFLNIPAVSHAAEELAIEVREISGQARLPESVGHRLELPRPVSRNTPFALFDDKGKPVTAQFSPADEGDRQAAWWLDFDSFLGPWETRRYTVRYGEDVPAGPVKKRGHELTESETDFKITNAPAITWTVPRDLAGLLRSVDFPPSEHLLPDSPGLVLRDRNGREHVLGKGFHAGRVVRQGRQAIALRFTGTARDEALAGVRSTVDLIFPTPVSWVEVDWLIDDPQARVSGLGSILRMALDPPERKTPTLVDFGVGTWVYAALSADQAAELQATPRNDSRARERTAHPGTTPAWRVLRGTSGRMTPFVVASPEPGAAAEGWAHIMDRQRCLALAVHDFAREANERISLTGKGEVALWRDYAEKSAPPQAGPKRFRFWLHFVFYPPQWSAGSNPRMMQTPPIVTTVKPAGVRMTPAK